MTSKKKIATSSKEWRKNYVLEFHGSMHKIIRNECALKSRSWCQVVSWSGNSPDLNLIKLSDEEAFRCWCCSRPRCWCCSKRFQFSSTIRCSFIQMIIISVMNKSSSTNETIEAPNQIPIRPPKLLVQLRKPFIPDYFSNENLLLVHE